MAKLITAVAPAGLLRGPCNAADRNAPEHRPNRPARARKSPAFPQYCVGQYETRDVASKQNSRLQPSVLLNNGRPGGILGKLRKRGKRGQADGEVGKSGEKDATLGERGRAAAQASAFALANRFRFRPGTQKHTNQTREHGWSCTFCTWQQGFLF